jgi:hypothetical protein
MQATEAAPCKTRDILKARLRADLKVYADATAALQRNVGNDFEKAHLRGESARRAYEVARKKLNEHIASHGCGSWD